MKKITQQLIISVMLSFLFFSSLQAGNKQIGGRCATDGQCASGECKKFRCIALEENSLPTGNKEIEQVLNKFDNIIPILNQAGFEIQKLKVEIKLIPSVSAYVKQVKTLSKSQQRQLLNIYANNKYSVTILKTLFSVYSFKFGNYDLNESILQLNPPKATVFLQRK